jgi:hypothetical protein
MADDREVAFTPDGSSSENQVSFTPDNTSSSGTSGMDDRTNSPSDALESSAEYVRRKDVDAMKDDLAGRIRENPLISVGIALSAGFIISRILD